MDRAAAVAAVAAATYDGLLAGFHEWIPWAVEEASEEREFWVAVLVALEEAALEEAERAEVGDRFSHINIRFRGMKQKLALIAGPLAFLVIDLIPIDGLEPAAHSIGPHCLDGHMVGFRGHSHVGHSAFARHDLATASGDRIETCGGCILSPIIFLFLGGFAMALSIEKWGLHQRLALGIIKRTGSRSRSIVLGFIPGHCPFWPCGSAIRPRP